jgi:hypothetical protein
MIAGKHRFQKDMNFSTKSRGSNPNFLYNLRPENALCTVGRPTTKGSENANPHGIIEGSLEVKLPTIWTDEKQSRAEAERRERLAERRVEEKE